MPRNAAPVTLETGVRGDIQRLLTGPVRSEGPQVNPSAASALDALKLPSANALGQSFTVCRLGAWC